MYLFVKDNLLLNYKLVILTLLNNKENILYFISKKIKEI